MATRNIVPRATGEGNLGTSEKHWGGANIDSITGKTATIDTVTATELISRSFAALPVCYMRDKDDFDGS